MAPTEIRQARGVDLESLITLDHVARIEEERRELIESAILDQRCWVVAAGDTILGYGILSHEFFGRSFLELIYIEKKQRSKGYGPQLISFLESYSKSPDLFTSTNESDIHMQYVLEALGYEKSGVINNLDPGDPEIVYFKKLVSI